MNGNCHQFACGFFFFSFLLCALKWVIWYWDTLHFITHSSRATTLFKLLTNCRNVIMSRVCSIFFSFTHLNGMHTITWSMKRIRFCYQLRNIWLIFVLRFFEGFSHGIQSVYKKKPIGMHNKRACFLSFCQHVKWMLACKAKILSTKPKHSTEIWILNTCCASGNLWNRDALKTNEIVTTTKRESKPFGFFWTQLLLIKSSYFISQGPQHFLRHFLYIYWLSSTFEHPKCTCQSCCCSSCSS